MTLLSFRMMIESFMSQGYFGGKSIYLSNSSLASLDEAVFGSVLRSMATADSGNLHLGSTPRISIESYLFENVRFFFSGYQPSEPATASSAGSSETVRSCWNSFAAANATCRRSVGWIWSTSPPAFSPAAPVKTRLHFILMTRNKNKQLKPLARKQFRWRRREERPRHRTSRVFRAIKTKIELDSTTNVPTHHHLLIFRSPRPTSHVWPKEKYTRLPPCRWN